jgi:uncharacterized protein YegP (UPF0339 family)
MTDEQLQPGWSTYKDEAGEFRWRYVSTHNGNILADSSEGYEREVDALAGMEAVKLAGAVAFAADNPISTTELEPVLGVIGQPDLPDPLPSPQQAATELNGAMRGFNVAEQNLSHGTDENMVRYAVEYVLAERRLNRAITIVEVVGKDGAGVDGEPVDEQA